MEPLVTFPMPTLNNKTNGCRFKFNAVILRKLSIQRLVDCGRALVLFLEKLENGTPFEMDFVLAFNHVLFWYGSTIQ